MRIFYHKNIWIKFERNYVVYEKIGNLYKENILFLWYKILIN